MDIVTQLDSFSKAQYNKLKPSYYDLWIIYRFLSIYNS